MLLAEGWNSPRATVVMHLAPTASKRVYQQRIGRIMRMHPRKEAGIVVDFVNKGATHNDRVVSLHSLLGADFYREGARVTPAPRRRPNRRARRKLSPAPWLVPVTPDVRRRLAVIQREWQRIDPRYLDEDEQRYWASIAGRQVRFEERADFVKKLSDGKASKGVPRAVPGHGCGREPEPPAADDGSLRPRLDDASSAPTSTTSSRSSPRARPWDKDRIQGARILLRAIGEGKADAPEQILARWTWKLARATRKAQDRRVSAEFPEAKRLLGALANSRGHRHEENAAKLVNAALELPIEVGVALLASAEGYTPRATKLIEGAREKVGTLAEVAYALAENLPAAQGAHGQAQAQAAQAQEGGQQHGRGPGAAGQRRTARRPPKRRRRRRKPAQVQAERRRTTEPAQAAEA